MALDAISAGWFIPWVPEIRSYPLTRENIARFPRPGAAEAVSLMRRFDAAVTNPHKTAILQACDLGKRGVGGVLN